MYIEEVELTPQDILEKEFKIDARGYRPQEVDKFLDSVIKDYTIYETANKRLVKENDELHLEIKRLEAEIRRMKTNLEAAESSASEGTSNVDILRRLSQLEKIVFGK